MKPLKHLKTFLLFGIWQTETAMKTDVFCICYFLKMKNVVKRKTGHYLIHLNKPACKFGAVLAMFNFRQKSLLPFFHWTLQWLRFGRLIFRSHMITNALFIHVAERVYQRWQDCCRVDELGETAVRSVNISNTNMTFQTLRWDLQQRRFDKPSRCLEIWRDTVSSVWYNLWTIDYTKRTQRLKWYCKNVILVVIKIIYLSMFMVMICFV